jgi:hypothetical protein
MAYSADKDVDGLTAITSIDDADSLVIGDNSDAVETAKQITWANTKAAIKTYYDAVTSTLTNKTFDANGTGNSISNIDVADLAAGTDGELITWDAAGAPAVVATGSATQVLTSNGAGAAPTFQAASGGDVTVSGTPANNQVSVWTDASTIEGDAALTFDTTTDTLATGIVTTTGAVTATGAVTGSNLSGTNTGDEVAASLTTAGVIEIATPTEVNTGTDDTRAVSPVGLTAWTGDTAIVTTGALNAGSITSGFGAIDNGASAITTTGVITGGTVEATTDTAAGDNSALGYTATEGAVLTGQGSTNDVTIKNDADATVLGIPTGTSNVTLGVDGTASDIIMTEKSAIRLDPAGGADGDYSGITFVGTAGATVGVGDVLYLKAADSEWYLCDASAVATAGTVAVAIAVSTGTDGNPVTLMTHGILRADAGFPALTIGAPVYISETGTTTNTVTVTAPTTADAVIKIVGYALTANEMLVQISPDHITVTG